MSESLQDRIARLDEELDAVEAQEDHHHEEIERLCERAMKLRARRHEALLLAARERGILARLAWQVDVELGPEGFRFRLLTTDEDGVKVLYEHLPSDPEQTLHLMKGARFFPHRREPRTWVLFIDSTELLNTLLTEWNLGGEGPAQEEFASYIRGLMRGKVASMRRRADELEGEIPTLAA